MITFGHNLAVRYAAASPCAFPAGTKITMLSSATPLERIAPSSKKEEQQLSRTCTNKLIRQTMFLDAHESAEFGVAHLGANEQRKETDGRRHASHK